MTKPLFPVLKDSAWLQEQLALGLSNREIARLVGCSPSHVCKSIKEAGLQGTPYFRFRVDEAGRECSRCREYKLWSDYYTIRSSSTGYESACKACQYTHQKGRSYALRLFGIVQADYDWLLDQQSGKCALCFRVETREVEGRCAWSLAVDHDHSHCGPKRACKECIRGLLCASCNTLLGRVELIGGSLAMRFSDYLGSRPFIGGDE